VGAVLAMAIAAVMPSVASAQTAPTAAAGGSNVTATTTTRESRFSRSAEREIMFQDGLLAYNRGELAAAEKDFRQVVQGDPADAQAWYYLGLTQLDQGRAAESVKSFDQSLRLDTTRPEVRAARATANIRARNYDAAHVDLNELEGDPRWKGMVEYLRGQEAYAKGDLKAAQQHFANARALGGTEGAPAEFYEGLTYLRMRELVRARSAFRQSALSGADIDPTLAAASRQLDTVLENQTRTVKPWSFNLSLGYEYDSNVIELGGSTSAESIGISGEAANTLVIQPSGSYSFIRNAKIDAGIEGTAYLNWHDSGLSDFDTQSYQAGPFVNYKVNDNLWFSARYGFNYALLGLDPFLTRHLFTPQLTYLEKNFGYTSGYYQLILQDFNDDPTGVSEPLDRDGYINALGVVQGINLPPLFAGADPANLELTYRYENQQTDGSDFDGNFNTLGATLYAPLPWWKMRADIGGALSGDWYSHGNSLDPDNDKRKDWEYALSAGLTKQINEILAIRADFTWTDHHSNVDVYDFDRYVAGIRLLVSY
jgi:tetratricopeptide (TPR) repeat protein